MLFNVCVPRPIHDLNVKFEEDPINSCCLIVLQRKPRLSCSGPKRGGGQGVGVNITHGLPYRCGQPRPIEYHKRSITHYIKIVQVQTVCINLISTPAKHISSPALDVEKASFNRAAQRPKSQVKGQFQHLFAVLSGMFHTSL